MTKQTTKYIVISCTERNTILLTDNDGKNVFTDKNLAKQTLFQDFATMYKEKTGNTITYDEFLDIGDYGEYEYGVDQSGENAWINDVHGQNFDVNIIELKENQHTEKEVIKYDIR